MIVAITMGVSLFLIFITIIILYLKTKKLKDKNLKDRLINGRVSEKSKAKKQHELDRTTEIKKELNESFRINSNYLN